MQNTNLNFIVTEYLDAILKRQVDLNIKVENRKTIQVA